MSEKKQKPVADEKTEPADVVVVNAGAPPAEIDELSEQYAGQGVSTEAADNLVPLIYVLQGLSPQVDEGNSQYMPGARPGTIWMRNAPTPLVPGDQGIIFQPCHFSKDWPEWVPRGRGGGFVARHDTRLATAADVAKFGVALKIGEDIPDVEDAVFTIDQRTQQKQWQREGNKNDLVFTRSHAGYVVTDNLVMPFVIPLKGASHKVSKTWMFMMMSDRTASGKIRPSFASLYRLTTRQFKNPQGAWYAFDIARAGYVDVPAFKRGAELCAAFEAGEKVAEAEVSAGTSEEAAAASQTGSEAMGDEIPF